MFAWESLRTEKGQPHSPSSHRHHLLLLEEKANRKQELHEQKRYPKCVLCWQHGSFCRNESSKGVQKRNKTTQNRTQPSDQEASLHKAGTCVCKDSLLLTSAKEENESWSRSSYFHCYSKQKMKWILPKLHKIWATPGKCWRCTCARRVVRGTNSWINHCADAHSNVMLLSVEIRARKTLLLFHTQKKVSSGIS